MHFKLLVFYVFSIVKLISNLFNNKSIIVQKNNEQMLQTPTSKY